jgi:hypothetical protein
MSGLRKSALYGPPKPALETFKISSASGFTASGKAS